MAGCVAIVSDLIFASRITGTAAKVGASCQVVCDSSTLLDALNSGEPNTVLVDLHCARLVPAQAIRVVKEHCPKARVVAFFSHVQTELAEQASAAGADDVWPRSVFVQRLEQLLEDTQAGNGRV